MAQKKNNLYISFCVGEWGGGQTNLDNIVFFYGSQGHHFSFSSSQGSVLSQGPRKKQECGLSRYRGFSEEKLGKGIVFEM